MSAEVTFTNAWVIDRDAFYVAGAGDIFEPHHQFTRLFQYCEENAPRMWSKHDVAWEAIALTVHFPPERDDEWALIAMSTEGHVEFSEHTSRYVEKIPGAGVFSEGAKGWGYMRTLRQIGDHLYAVGGAGQVYKRTAPNQWVHMDDGILQAPNVEDRLLLADIHGDSEEDIYVCGGIPGAYGLEGRLYHWDGKQWAALSLPTTERLTAIHVEDASTIWICGANGTLLRGNWKDGFKDLSTVDDNQLFSSITQFNNQIYLASNLGLFVFDGKTIKEVQTGLTPELQDANVVDAVDGVLWSIGPKDIAKFDGITWTRIDHPDNPPIR